MRAFVIVATLFFIVGCKEKDNKEETVCQTYQRIAIKQVTDIAEEIKRSNQLSFWTLRLESAQWEAYNLKEISVTIRDVQTGEYYMTSIERPVDSVRGSVVHDLYLQNLWEQCLLETRASR